MGYAPAPWHPGTLSAEQTRNAGYAGGALVRTKEGALATPRSRGELKILKTSRAEPVFPAQLEILKNPFRRPEFKRGLRTRVPRWKISTVVLVMRASTSSRMSREGTE